MTPEAEEIYKKHMGNPNDPIGKLLSDSKGTILAINSTFEKVFGYSSSDLVGKKIEVLLPPEFQEKHIHLREDYVANEPRPRLMGHGRNLFGLHKDGHQVHIDLGLEPIKGKDQTYVIATLVGIKT